MKTRTLIPRIGLMPSAHMEEAQMCERQCSFLEDSFASRRHSDFKAHSAAAPFGMNSFESESTSSDGAFMQHAATVFPCPWVLAPTQESERPVATAGSLEKPLRLRADSESRR
jgi:hypothetical protein